MANIIFSVYTRTPEPEIYPGGLAFSVHFAYSREGGEQRPLNKNYGILFEKGDISDQNQIMPRGVRNPKVFAMEDGVYGVCGQRTYENGDPDEACADRLLLWTTKDFIRFERVGLVDPAELTQWQPDTSVEVEKAIAEEAITYWTPVENIGLEVPQQVEVTCEAQLDDICATALYSDGSRAVKKLHWDKTGIDFSKPGTYQAQAAVGQPPLRFPLANGYGDPVLLKWEGKWHFIATNDNLDDVGLYIRQGDTVEDLFREDVVEHLILPLDPERHLIQTFWAPEFHLIGGELYILFAVGPEKWGPQCHMMKLKKGCSLIEADSWEDPVRVVKADGTPLTEDAITLDMTFIPAESGSYVVWSYREHIMTPMDSGSMLYIATIDEAQPWKLTSEPVLLTRPLHGWENVDGTINNEGPYAFIRDHKIYLTYSGGSANAYTYALGLLTADDRDDLLNLASWYKSHTPVLTYYSVEGEYGPGHNSFYTNDDGELMIAYHAETDIREHLRCDGIRRVHFRKDGRPDFELSNEQDLRQEYRRVRVTVTVKGV